MLTKSRMAAAVIATGSALAAFPAGASALNQTVTGTSLSNIALSAPVTATFGTSLSGGATATSTAGSVSVVDTNASWTLAANDATATTGDGHLKAAASGCTGSESELAQAVKLQAGTPTPTGPSIAAQFSLPANSASAATMLSGTAPIPLTVVPTNFSQTVGTGETLLGGCVYTITVAYTLS